MKLIKASNENLKSSIQKLNNICTIIRKKYVAEAILQLEFCKKSIAKDIIKIIKSAITNCQENSNIREFYINKVLIGKSRSIKRIVARARGRSNTIKKHYSKMTIFLEKRGV